MKRLILLSVYFFLALALNFCLMGVQPVCANNVRIMAANLTSGNSQNYDLGEGIRIFQGLKPDIVLIQEFKYKGNTLDDLRDLVDLAFGEEYNFSIEPGFLSELPNGIISRFTIIDSGEWKDNNMPNRDFAWAEIDVPGNRDLLAVSLHLKAGNSNRQRLEAEDLVAVIKNKDLTQKYLVIGGDFNTSSRGVSAITTLSEVVKTSKPYPVDQAGDPDTNSKRSKPYDAIYVSQDLEDLEIPVIIGAASFPNGLVFDSRVYSPLQDVSPVKEDDSDAVNMQHMAVVRDFDIQ
ncbi:MAG: endonuclease/exonuclease/phosphatase family protein [Xenococcus sp. (in: cyanobacteria)]